MADHSSSMIEGIGDEVLWTVLGGGVLFILFMAWMSTHLTNTQRLMPSLRRPRVERPGVTLNRIPDSSTEEFRNRQQLSSQASLQPASPPSQPDVVSAEPPAEPPAGSPAEPPAGSPAGSPVASSEDERSSGASDGSVSEAESPPVYPSTEQTEPSTEQPETPLESPPDDVIRVRLKFLTDNEIVVTARKTDTIGAFRRAHFEEEMNANKLVRFIFTGQRLEDNRTLQSYNIADNTVVHVLISNNPSSTSRTRSPTGSHVDLAVFNAGVFMIPLFTMMLGIIWYLWFEYPEYFNVTSTLSLTCITVVFLICMSATMRNQTPMTSNVRHVYNTVDVNPGTGSWT